MLTEFHLIMYLKYSSGNSAYIQAALIATQNSHVVCLHVKQCLFAVSVSNP